MFDQMNNGSEYQELQKKFNSKSASDNCPTAKLWIQYFKMVTLMERFIEAACCSFWDEYLEYVLQILPIFHAGGQMCAFVCAANAEIHE